MAQVEPGLTMRIHSLLAGLMLIGSAGLVSAADLPARTAPPPPPPQAPSGWTFQLTLYGWATALDGDIGARYRQPVDVNVGFDQILDNLKGGFMGAFQAKNDTWMVLADVVYSDLGIKRETRFGGQLDFSQTMGIATGYVGYRIPIGSPALDLRLIGGARGQNLEVDITHFGVLPAFDRTASASKSWIDPVVGFAMTYNFDKHWFLNVIADVGGFGVASQLTTQGFAAIGYRWTETISTSIGYRALYTDYKKNGFVYETTLHGVFAGIGVHF
ncbi:MAG: hypothetical protein ACK5QX_09380 [bacterium]